LPKLRVAFIGTGSTANRTGAAMAYLHGNGYQQLPDVEMVAAADLVEANARAFAEHFGFTATYTDYKTMLAEVKPDLVSIATWPHLHAQMVTDCAAARVPAVYCEKPMAYKWGDCKSMAAACEASGTMLTFAHQRRFSRAFSLARDLVADGAIGDLQTIEFGVGNLYDYGSHSFDLANFLNGECDVEWVLCGLDYSTEQLVFGTHNENHAVVVWRYANGVMGLGATGEAGPAVGCHHRLVGSQGLIEIGREGLPPLRVLRAGKDWEVVDTQGDGVHGGEFVIRAIADVVDCVRTGRESMLSARHALRSTEMIFAAWESVRRRGMVRLPLDIADNPLVEMVKAGELRPVKAE
jgi:UDP-N-acetylglucosamine 3-dehydrogenase